MRVLLGTGGNAGVLDARASCAFSAMKEGGVCCVAGRFGTLTHVPIHHLDRKLSFKELCALYAITDVALVTSLRDGMNLVSYEFVACQAENHGVLVLSEFAGAAQSLGAGSILVNPWNIDDMTTAIHEVPPLLLPTPSPHFSCSCSLFQFQQARFYIVGPATKASLSHEHVCNLVHDIYFRIS